MSFDRRRKLVNTLMTGLISLSVLLALIPLFGILVYVVKQGWVGLNKEFFTQASVGVGEPGGGMAHALAGTSLLVGMASLIGVPIGLSTALYLTEYGHKSRLSFLIRLSVDLLASIPSIVVGIFAYTLAVEPFKHFSGIAGSIALAVIMIPIVAKTSEEVLLLVPSLTREAGLALGIARRKVIFHIVLKGVLGSVMTGVILALARVSGETAPLLFTSLGNRNFSLNPFQPLAALPLQIYNYAVSPYDEWHNLAWAGALVLVTFVMGLNLISRWVLGRVKGHK